MPLPAFESGFSFRCFLRSRRSMEMWRLDDTGRDSWDWVGPPTCETPQWSGGSSPVETEPLQTVFVIVVEWLIAT